MPRLKLLMPPLNDKQIGELKVGDFVAITGRIITARDKAYARIISLLREGKKLPVELKGEVIYHCGPIVREKSHGWEVISAGPTTSARLDDMQVEFVKNTGVRALVGKGGVSDKVAAELSRLGCVYLAFTGGAGVLATNSIVNVEKVLWKDLGLTEAMWVLMVEKFGLLTVAIDVHGQNLYRKSKLKDFSAIN